VEDGWSGGGERGAGGATGRDDEVMGGAIKKNMVNQLMKGQERAAEGSSGLASSGPAVRLSAKGRSGAVHSPSALLSLPTLSKISLR